ncbi:Hypoxic response protein 1 [Pirellulimonas nuda]|uniref:Hypoxic response protein 1 n=1 Tax=Pirellulimonas nuda TaxID=2528009 RepID=A0A518DEJ4_9BACT|nr:CBS domain-containing protein [Pirellulimonas nuda]QDU89905.1 Hypoxic response protein 1 [Pirellulimonas nuda]
MKVAGQIMNVQLDTIDASAPVRDAIDLLLNHNYSGLPVVDGAGKLLGVITEYALLAIAYDENVENQTVGEHMTKDLVTADVNESVRRIADLFIVHRVRRIPVTKDGKLVGQISRRDVLRALRANSPSLAAV